MIRLLVVVFILSVFSSMAASQEQKNEKSQTETQIQFNLDEFEIIHLSSGVQGETIIHKEQSKQIERSSPFEISREKREEMMRQLQEIRTAIRKIEDDTSQQNPELKVITDKINDLQQQRKARLDELLANNQEYQTLKQKIASGQNFQSSDAMQMSMIERRASSQDQQIKQIEQQIKELMQQKQTLLQTALQNNQEYQNQRQQMQTIIQQFTGRSIMNQSSFSQPGSGWHIGLDRNR